MKTVITIEHGEIDDPIVANALKDRFVTNGTYRDQAQRVTDFFQQAIRGTFDVTSIGVSHVGFPDVKNGEFTAEQIAEMGTANSKAALERKKIRLGIIADKAAADRKFKANQEKAKTRRKVGAVAKATERAKTVVKKATKKKTTSISR